MGSVGELDKQHTNDHTGSCYPMYRSVENMSGGQGHTPYIKTLHACTDEELQSGYNYNCTL